ncbi:hypothetical protein [Romboutsia timonensis]|uniref:hypothetical protein n=1 Tax=Romboutsia timonensis TaxID=1776391 RepID=UPI0039996004
MNKRDTYMKLEFEIYNKKNNNELILMAICKGDKFEIVENNNKKVLHITDDNNNLLLKILIKTIEINEIEENLYKITV